MAGDRSGFIINRQVPKDSPYDIKKLQYIFPSLLFPWAKTETNILYMWLAIAEKSIASVVFAPDRTREVLVVVFISNFGDECFDQVREPS